MPWMTVIDDGKPRVGVHLLMNEGEDNSREFIVNSAPIYGDNNEVKGVMVSFSDVTELTKKNIELKDTLGKLESSQEKVLEQNKKLKIMATRDPMTGCLNRRAFFNKIDKEYFSVIDNDRVISCVMTDIDHFKSFNDTYGHSVGDQVIQIFAKALSSALRANDYICRYGGKEFCIILMDPDEKRSI
jgi:PleD family two-component response regulator